MTSGCGPIFWIAVRKRRDDPFDPFYGAPVLAIDEIGGEEEIRALEYAMHCGCKLIASVHGSDLEEISERPGVKELIEQRRFERYIVLDHEGKPGTVRGIYDERGIRLCGK